MLTLRKWLLWRTSAGRSVSMLLPRSLSARATHCCDGNPFRRSCWWKEAKSGARVSTAAPAKTRATAAVPTPSGQHAARSAIRRTRESASECLGWLRHERWPAPGSPRSATQSALPLVRAEAALELRCAVRCCVLACGVDGAAAAATGGAAHRRDGEVVSRKAGRRRCCCQAPPAAAFPAPAAPLLHAAQPQRRRRRAAGDDIGVRHCHQCHQVSEACSVRARAMQRANAVQCRPALCRMSWATSLGLGDG